MKKYFIIDRISNNVIEANYKNILFIKLGEIIKNYYDLNIKFNVYAYNDFSILSIRNK